MKREFREGVNKIDNIYIEEIMQTPKHPKRIIIAYPADLAKDIVFQDNKKGLVDKFYLWLDIDIQIKYEEKALSVLKFDVQIDKQTIVVNDLKKQASEIEYDMNASVSPYYWRIVKDVEGYLGNLHIKADYVLVLDNKM